MEIFCRCPSFSFREARNPINSFLHRSCTKAKRMVPIFPRVCWWWFLMILPPIMENDPMCEGNSSCRDPFSTMIMGGRVITFPPRSFNLSCAKLMPSTFPLNQLKTSIIPSCTPGDPSGQEQAISHSGVYRDTPPHTLQSKNNSLVNSTVGLKKAGHFCFFCCRSWWPNPTNTEVLHQQQTCGKSWLRTDNLNWNCRLKEWLGWLPNPGFRPFFYGANWLLLLGILPCHFL